MDLKRYAVILTAIMMMCTSGCGNVKSTNKTEKANSSSVTKSVASTVSMPDPVPVPEGGWTDETIKDVIYINGKNLELPCTIDDLGDGFEIVPNEESDERMKEKGSASYDLNYYGYDVGVVSLKDNGEKLTSISLFACELSDVGTFNEDFPNVPFSINGVAIGTPYSEVQKNLGEEFSYEDYSITDTHSNIYFSSEHFWLAICVSNDDKVSAIQLFSR